MSTRTKQPQRLLPRQLKAMAKAVYPVAIVGAGASGLMAAIAASRVRPHSVFLLEKEARVGRKLLATGNGRCNLLNASPEAGRIHGSGKEAALPLLMDAPNQLPSYFASLGLRCREEGEGRVYPYSGQASAVLDVLRAACDRLGVTTATDAQITGISHQQGVFSLYSAEGTYQAQRVILAGGGKAAPSFGADGNAYALLTAFGHQLLPTFPSITPLKLPLDRIRGLKGVRAPVRLALHIHGQPAQQESGEGLFTDYGLSGVAAMQLGRWVQTAKAGKKPCDLSIELMPFQAAAEEAARRGELFAGEPLETFFTGLLHKRIGLCLLREAHLSPQDTISAATVKKLLPLLSDWRMPVLGTQPFANAQVTAGGISLDGFHPQTLESLLQPGLYACGEILDVDGDCGGYNLMWAWASAIAAGEAAATSLLSQS